MINPSDFFNLLKKEIGFFTGVPDSTLKEICAYITQNTTDEEHIITANEGNAIALASGYHLATRKISLVYMQNSGLGNAVNPLTSLCDKEVYRLPLLLMIGWRGQPGIKDEPQHVKKGRITLDLLKTLEIPYEIINKDFNIAKEQIQKMMSKIKETNSPCALIIEKKTFEEYKLTNNNNFELSREDAVDIILNNLKESDVVVSTTGKTSREVYELREKYGVGHKKDFLTVGSMGHTSSIGLGIALNKKDRKVIVLDGDGSVIMHMGSLGIIGELNPNNLKHVVLNNGAHDSVGGQPSVGLNINLSEIAKNCNYKETFSVKTKEELQKILPDFLNNNKLSFLEIKIKKGARKDLGRPKTTPIENKKDFMDFLR